MSDDQTQIRHAEFFQTPDTPGIVFYAGFGRPCPRCKSRYMNSHDFALHEKVCRERQWHPSNYDDGEVCPSEKEPQLTAACRSGKVRNGLYEYSLNANGKWLKRRKIA